MIPVNEPAIGEKEIEYVVDCLKTGWISSTGKYIEEFEKKCADYCGMQYGIAVSNGTVALETAIKSLGLTPEDEIILPTFTIISCALAIINNKCKPVLVDSEPRTWTIDVNKIEKKITSKTKAIMPVHIYGHPCDMDKIWDIAKKYGLVIIEDAAEAHGAEYKGEKCGGLGEISCFSFYANKIITTGEGGMVLTNNEEYAQKARSLRNLCFREDRRFYHTELGSNFRLTNVQAAIGLAQIEKIDKLIEKKRWMGSKYNEYLNDISGITLPVEEAWAKNVYWMYGIVLDNNKDIDATELARRLKKEGVDTRPFFLGMHEQPAFHRMGLFIDEHFPVAENISRQGLYLPSGLTITEKQIQEVSNLVRRCLAHQ
ncbi:MAG: DegT/DnrJ/EryC1/StrS family aminotransferase [Nitrospiraceae bacterium]|nr:MAG: DegT/DnrJ/EryC1/StrS family aminotransferase [Nitrospiraceae bacterium]